MCKTSLSWCRISGFLLFFSTIFDQSQFLLSRMHCCGEQDEPVHLLLSWGNIHGLINGRSSLLCSMILNVISMPNARVWTSFTSRHPDIPHPITSFNQSSSIPLDLKRALWTSSICGLCQWPQRQPYSYWHESSVVFAWRGFQQFASRKDHSVTCSLLWLCPWASLQSDRAAPASSCAFRAPHCEGCCSIPPLWTRFYRG